MSSGSGFSGTEVAVGRVGAGPNEEEAELEGDASVESIQTAESRDDVELLRFALRAFIQGCCRHLVAVSRFLKGRKRRVIAIGIYKTHRM